MTSLYIVYKQTVFYGLCLKIKYILSYLILNGLGYGQILKIERTKAHFSPVMRRKKCKQTFPVHSVMVQKLNSNRCMQWKIRNGMICLSRLFNIDCCK